MKLKTRLYLLAVLPVLILAVVLAFIAANELANAVFDTNYAGMQATATTMRDLIGSVEADDGNSEEANKETLDSMDYIKEQTGYDITYFQGDTRYLTTITDDSGKRQTGTKANQDVIDAVLGQGKDYKNNNINILGTRYIGYYVPVFADGSDSPSGMTFLGVPYQEVYVRITENVRMILAAAVFLLAVAIIFAWRMGKVLTQDIQTGIGYVQELEKGKLGFEIEKRFLSRPDVIGDMCRSIKSLNDRLTIVVKDIKEQCRTLNDSVITTSQTANDLNDSFTQISAVVEEVAATTTSQAEDAEQANGTIQVMGNLIEHISEESSSAMSTLDDLVADMQKVDQAVSAISRQAGQTCSSVDKIDSAAELISSISLQTRLLSLNASIEAARAGEHGKGFAVVAAEIQQLAYGSEESSKEIQTILDELKHNSEQSLNGSKEVIDTVSSLRDKLHKTEEVFMSLLREIGLEKTADPYSDQAETSLHGERAKTVSAVNELAAASEEIAASMEQTAASVESVNSLSESMELQAEDLRNVSDTLNEHLKYFVISNG